MGKLEKAFWQFHLDNPLVYERLVKYAREWKRNHNHCSIKFLYERVRWDFGMDTTTDDSFKLSNNHCPFYARLIDEKELNMKGLFRFRQQRVQCSFGPLNESLPSGEHHA